MNEKQRIEWETKVILRTPNLKVMEVVDSLHPQWRAVIHEYGYHIVRTCLDSGVKLPSHVHQIVTAVRDHYLGHPVEYKNINKIPPKDRQVRKSG